MWTSYACLFAYALEKDVDYNMMKHKPEFYTKLYGAGQKRAYFGYRTFWKWILFSIYHGAIIFFSTTYGLDGATDDAGRTEEMWFKSTIAFSCIIHLVTLKLMVELIYLNWIVILFMFLSLFLYWSMVILANVNVFARLI